MDSKEDNVTEKKEGHDDTQSTTSETKTALENEKTENSPLVSQPDYGKGMRPKIRPQRNLHQQ